MKNVILFGIGKYVDIIESLLQEDVHVLFYMDNDKQKQTVLRNGKKIYAIKEMPEISFDYIIISAFSYKKIEFQLIKNGFKKEQIIAFFGENIPFGEYDAILNPLKSIQYSLECRLEYNIRQLEYKYELLCENTVFEMADMIRKESVKLPQICTVEETCKKIIEDKVSLSRYGDGEFQIILGAAKDVYQDDDERLGERLKEILISNYEKHIVALADDYGCMEGIREENKDSIRKYMTREKRRQHYQYIDMNKKYYNAYVSRPYVIYPHNEREQACNRFKELKKIWNGQKVILVEGEYTRMGIGNDLFENAKSIERIIAPNKNAFSVYDKLFEAVLRVNKDRLILIALGPTATVLAYDLARKGYWAIDIGHLDLEYEWYLKGEGYSQIPNKYNNEVLGGTVVEEIEDEDYNKSIIDVVGI